MGRRRHKGRDVQGIVLLDKPIEMGSNEALQVVKRLFEARKAGHTGSLDRLASGLLPICLGEATKMSGFLLNADKRYRAVFKLGEKTTTGDAEGEIVAERPVGELSRAQVEAAMDRFRGPIQQVPPMHSALKHQGQRLYQLAHQGIEVERAPREVVIHAFELLEVRGELLEVQVHCSKGTYIRTLAEDLGEVLGCGGRIESLRRLGTGPFDDSGMVTLEHLRGLAGEGLDALDAVLLPLDAAVAHWPEVRIGGDVSYYVRKGQAVIVPHAPTSGWVRIYETAGSFLGVGQVLGDGRIAPRRLINVSG